MSSTSKQQADKAAYWNGDAARVWLSDEARLDDLFRPLGQAALVAAAPRLGEKVIDVGCGTGEMVIALANSVGPSGHVLGIDIAESLVNRGRARLAEKKLKHAQIISGDAAFFQSAEKFDLVFSRLGVMFFDDPIMAFARLRDAAVRGGRLTFVAWRGMQDNPYFLVPLEAARRWIGAAQSSPVPAIVEKAFSFSSENALSTLLKNAGWSVPSLSRLDFSFRLAGPGGAEEAASLVTRIGPVTELLARADPRSKAAAISAIVDAMEAHETQDGISLMGSTWLVTARA
ncbi:class I SAM-dependent methyltransferase [Rhizobium rhizogenes]|uniref:class I SAM-dependent methyltransferase n=1 Tax=Rhizobium rhizogenes TaxID=359 RepID=UPI0012954D65|nr:methyltransferase domain-containing protein [Rhizobium rhizogenes]MQB34203.1 methyltransferase domain-containing protein [Rhizobium rhizogenes]